MDRQTTRRNSSISVSASIDATDENQEICWPALSSSEMQDMITKQARHTASCSSGVLDECNQAVDLANLHGNGSTSKSGARLELHSDNGEQEMGTWTLQRSNNFCSPFELGDRGYESWRDLL
jgi:hypothetical protein